MQQSVIDLSQVVKIGLFHSFLRSPYMKTFKQLILKNQQWNFDETSSSKWLGTNTAVSGPLRPLVCIKVLHIIKLRNSEKKNRYKNIRTKVV